MNFWDQPQLPAKSQPGKLRELAQGHVFLRHGGEPVRFRSGSGDPAWLETEYAGRSGRPSETGIAGPHVSFESQPPTGTTNQALAAIERLNGEPREHAQSQVHVRKLRGRGLQSVRAAAAQSVAANPSRSYNPLFLYGGVGMGKTHLMHAIGRELIDRYGGDARDLHLERAVHERDDRLHPHGADAAVSSALPRGRRAADRRHPAVGNKERTQEEFFHTFNELHDHQKQIVISSDSPPKDIRACSSVCGRVSSGG